MGPWAREKDDGHRFLLEYTTNSEGSNVEE